MKIDIKECMEEPTSYQPLPPILAIYGPAGAGKTTTAQRSENPFFIRTEHNCPTYAHLGERGRTFMPGYPRQGQIGDWATLVGVVESLMDRRTHDRKTVILDSWDAALELARQDVVRVECKGNVKEFSNYNKGQGWVRDRMVLLLQSLQRLQKQGLLVIILCHEGDGVRQANYDGEDYLKSGGACYRSSWLALMYFCTQVAQIHTEVTVVKEGFKGKGKGDNKRYLCFEGSTTRDAKCNSEYSISGKIPCSWASYINASLDLDWIKHSNYLGDK